MVKVTIEIDGVVSRVMTGEYAWGSVSSEKDSSIDAQTFLVGRTNASILGQDVACSIPEVIMQTGRSTLQGVSELTKLAADIMRYVTKELMGRSNHAD
ncbi:MAG: hypothetical protein KH230_22820 [Enterocloster asparagiformis]|nr:hypothetical protein [Enterocloster asparagiformis]